MNNTNITFSLSEKIESANRQFSLFDNTQSVLVGLSGGADSTCLLLSLKLISQKYGFKVYAVHINHMIRGKEADRDEEFSRLLCKKQGIEFFSVKVDIPKLALETGDSIELVARNERYRIFKELCQKHGISAVATAHTASDSCETVLFNFIRGSGGTGLCGIPPRRVLGDGISVIRPLIFVTRDEVERFLGDNNQDYVTDSSNLEDDYTRNLLRNKVIPQLKAINPSLENSVQRLSRISRCDCEYLDKKAMEALTDSLEVLCTLDYSILSRVIIKLFSSYSNLTPKEIHIRALCDRIYQYKSNPQNLTLSFSEGFIARFYNGKLSFEKEIREKNTFTSFKKTLQIGTNFFEQNDFAIYLNFDQIEDIPQNLYYNENIYKKYTTDYLYFDTIHHSLYARNRQEGDVIFSNSMHKRIKRLMSGSEFNEKERSMLPLICNSSEQILLVPSIAQNDNCKNNNAHSEKLCVTLYRKDKCLNKE